MKRASSPAVALALAATAVMAAVSLPLASADPAAGRETIDSVPILAGPPAGGPGSGDAAGASAPMIDTARQSRLEWPIDPDDASYALVRWYLDRRSLPPPEAIRVGSLANAFGHTSSAPPAYAVGLTAEVFPSPIRAGRHILSLEVRTAEADRRPGGVFVVVVESTAAAVPRIRAALRRLAAALDDRDRLAVVAHGPRGRMILEPARTDSRSAVDRATDELRGTSAPDLAAGLQLGYELAARGSAGGSSRILLFSDGAGLRPPGEAFFAGLRRQARAGTTLSVVGLPVGSTQRAAYDDRLLARLARDGGGRYAMADNASAAARLLSRLPDTLAVVARDVTGRIALDPETVSRFRFLGSPPRPAAGGGRALAASGRATALIELQLTGRSGALGTVQVGYRPVSGGAIKQLEVSLPGREAMPDDGGRRLPWIAATFGEKLSGSYWTREVSYRRLLRAFRSLDAGLRTDPRTAELRYLIQQAERLEPRRARPRDPKTDPEPSHRDGDPFDQLRVIE